MEIPDFYNLVSREFGQAVLLTSCPKFWVKMGPVLLSSRQKFRLGSRIVPIATQYFFRVCSLPYVPFGNPVCLVLFVGTFKQMPRVHAGRVITMMKSEWVWWSSVMKYERYSMSKEGHVVRTKDSIVCGTTPSYPQPAFIEPRLTYFGPESLDLFFGKWWNRFGVVAGHLDHAPLRPHGVGLEDGHPPAPVASPCGTKDKASITEAVG